ncbi:MAG TPA: hypothetical protein VMM38_01185 [Aridibacter sp.]|nr:hypothetical protein [Aridibacter sp.]
MTQQICVKCKTKAMTWGETGEEGEERTWWHCSECGFEIEEDVSKECWCGLCKSGIPSVSWLIEDGEGYFWCFNCGRKTDNTIYHENFLESMQQVIEELKMRSDPGTQDTDEHE